MTGIAAPLLTAASITITGVVVQQPDSLRWPGITLLVLVVASALLVTAVQLGFLARRHVARPDEIEAWWPSLTPADRAKRVRRDQSEEYLLNEWWADLARRAYNLGIVALWIGVGTAVAPHGDREQVMRWIAAWIAWALAIGEILWFALALWWPGSFVPLDAARRRAKRLGRPVCPSPPSATDVPDQRAKGV
jgi:hypothetical protein